MTKNAREVLACDPAAALRAAARMGRVMLTANAGGATHERIGPIETVLIDGPLVKVAGAAHDAVIDVARIGAVIADRTGRMKDKVMTRLEFHDGAGETIFSIVGLDGGEPFDDALELLGKGEPLAEKERGPANPAILEENDPGAAPFAAAAASGSPIVIAINHAGLAQRWSGVVVAMKPAMGFINVMTPDFHLHLRGGAVARWRREERDGALALIAQNAEGRDIGLHVSGPKSAFGDA